MAIGIRADWCIALRMIALHEFYRKNREALENLFGDDEVCRLYERVNRALSERKKDEGDE
jgi:hypothetical protein